MRSDAAQVETVVAPSRRQRIGQWLAQPWTPITFQGQQATDNTL